jgi:hypothetical protein
MEVIMSRKQPRINQFTSSSREGRRRDIEVQNLIEETLGKEGDVGLKFRELFDARGAEIKKILKLPDELARLRCHGCLERLQVMKKIEKHDRRWRIAKND